MKMDKIFFGLPRGTKIRFNFLDGAACLKQFLQKPQKPKHKK
jgi:hypothetical protein